MCCFDCLLFNNPKRCLIITFQVEVFVFTPFSLIVMYIGLRNILVYLNVLSIKSLRASKILPDIKNFSLIKKSISKGNILHFMLCYVFCQVILKVFMRIPFVRPMYTSHTLYNVGFI